ncbi:hypothetical protein Bca52824_072846 [Brassica carinata]|uniref:Uncharacterized protein n=1 Tax=Brassica carinata TaxID=52824 RepID=A0A8X7TH00_BRACI|nr:hypothetical protein Bca52824_096585 [Brassica carinata]KAG2265767.1 hypothetical protein Bca52824_072846 [Brassica carinata]
MAEKSQIPDNNNSATPSSGKKPAAEVGSGSSYPGQKMPYPNRPESVNPFGLGWIIKGSNPLPSLQSSSKHTKRDEDK